MLPSEIPKLPTALLVTVFPAVWELLLLHDSPPPGWVSVPNSFVSFCLLSSVLPPFEENRVPFLVPGVLRSCSVEVGQHSYDLLMDLRWRKWSSTILGPPPPCLTLGNPMDYSLPGSSVHGILQARILEWVAISSSRGSSQPRD